MNNEEVRAAVEAEIAGRQAALKKLPVEKVKEIYAAQVALFGKDLAFNATRTEVFAALHLENPSPHTHDPKDAMKTNPDGSNRSLTVEERNALHAKSRQGISDAHRILADHAKEIDPHVHNAHHFTQKCHQTGIWNEVSRALAEAGITPGGAS